MKNITFKITFCLLKSIANVFTWDVNLTYSLKHAKMDLSLLRLKLPPQFSGISGGLTLSIFSKIMVRLTWKFFWEDLYEFGVQKKFFRSIRIFYGLRIFYENRTFCKFGYFCCFRAIFTKMWGFLYRYLAILQVKIAKIYFSIIKNIWKYL